LQHALQLTRCAHQWVHVLYGAHHRVLHARGLCDRRERFPRRIGDEMQMKETWQSIRHREDNHAVRLVEK